MGGISEEKEISILSGRACARALKKKKYKVKVLDPKGNFINEIRKIHLFNNWIPNSWYCRFYAHEYDESVCNAENSANWHITRCWDESRRY